MKKNSHYEAFLLNYQELKPYEQFLLQVCSVLNMPVGKTEVFRCVKKIKLPVAQKIKAVAQAGIYLENLVYNGLIDHYFMCDEELREFITYQAVKEKTLETIEQGVLSVYPYNENSMFSMFMEFRVGLYLEETDRWEHAYHRLLDDHSHSPFIGRDPLIKVCANPFVQEIFSAFDKKAQFMLLTNFMNKAMNTCSDDIEIVDYIRNHYVMKKKDKNYNTIILNAYLSLRLLLSGEFDESKKLAQITAENGVVGYQSAVSSALEGSYQQALALFEEDLKKVKKQTGEKSQLITGYPGYIYILVLLKTSPAGDLPKISKLLKKLVKHHGERYKIFTPFYYLSLMVETRINPSVVVYFPRVDEMADLDDVPLFFAAYCEFAITGKIRASIQDLVMRVYKKSSNNGYDWVALECAELLLKAGKQSKDLKTYAENTSKKTGIVPIVSMIEICEIWEKQLDALVSACKNTGKSAGIKQESRLIWIMDFHDEAYIELTAKEQKLSVKGKWSKGRKVAMKRLHSGDGLDCMSGHDMKIRSAIEMDYGWYQGNEYSYDMDQLLPALVGHPFIYVNEEQPVPAEIVQGEPEVYVKKSGKHYHIAFENPVTDNKALIIQETPTRYRVTQFTDNHLKIGLILGLNGLKVPEHAKDRVLAAVRAVSSQVTVQSEIGGVDNKIPTVKSDSTPRIHLFPSGKGFGMEIFVKPLGNDGPLLKPGKGGATVIAEISGKRLQAKRGLNAESSHADAVEIECPVLADMDGENYQWIMDDTESCLELLLDLKRLQDKKNVIVEWPDGEKLKTTSEISGKNFNMKINSKQDWFELQGGLQIDSGQVIELKKLLDLTGQSKSRFIPLEDGQFLALTDKFRRRLNDLNRWTEKKKKNIGFHYLASPAMEELTEGLGQVKGDKGWKDQAKRLKDGAEYAPVIPSTLKAELREYQIEGFAWLSRLAFWGMGACLADDMGLGKTIQTLAVLLDRAPEGPSLVVAPTSVCMNWMEEAKRFAPTLNPILFGGQNREDLVQSLTHMDLLVVSYGLLQNESKLFSTVKWKTIVLDEAQAIKNSGTKRSRAAMTLQGDFKIITTGTPIENHLGELKNLFDFINPGLLGTDKRFNERFANPIEKNKDRDAGKSLKKFIRPFILRRLKSQVLEELPPKTEIVLQVEMGKEEASFYEALRLTSIEKLASGNGDKPGEKHLRILAEITRLRRACCNPKLVMPDSGISSSKLEQFGVLVDELIENRHKVLVFSQFTGHLALLREYLDNRSIEYRYLDGSTPQKKRKEQVDAFQSGKGDLFLISMKAGGSGLNLTAASYVIHMDPWWNPAVEDQASDRAHRIGQKHPVTVYRIVTKDTIEEKIIKLHGEKRGLAESLLDGSDMSGKMSADELMGLIRQ